MHIEFSGNFQQLSPLEKKLDFQNCQIRYSDIAYLSNDHVLKSRSAIYNSFLVMYKFMTHG